MHKNYFDEHSANNCDNSQRFSVRRPNANNLSLRTRTKSENGVLCGDGNGMSIIELNQNSKFDHLNMTVNNESNKRVKMRAPKRHMCSTDDGMQDMVVTAIYNYLPRQEDELSLSPGDKVRVLSNDFRDSGTEGWWVGMMDSKIGVFPVNYVHTDSCWSLNKNASEHDVPQVTPRTPNETFKIPFSQDCFVDIPCEKTNTNNINGFALSGSTGVRMISSTEISKMECLGSGSFGVVYHGRWHDKEVAVKTFSVFANELHIYQEAGHLSCLLHPNIVRLFGVSIINDMGSQIALIMEYARGGALHNFIHFPPTIKLSPHTLLLMSKQIASGMRYLHKEAGICHRDLKSSNVLIKEAIPDLATDTQIANCTLLITDFGMARRTAELVSQQSKLGTLAYAAPEVCKQQGGFSVKSDVWSYGVLLWELLTMEIPYRNFEQPHLLYKIAIKNHTLHIPSGIPSLLVNLLTSCWNEEKDLRPDFEEVNQVLHRAQKCKFMEISAEEFYSIQEVWREEISLSENINDESMTSSDTERDEFLEQQREIAYAKEELQRREEDMLRREAACSQAMGTVNQFKLLFSVLVANQLPHMSPCDDPNTMSPSPPVPPPRKRPFVGRLKFWGHANSCGNASTSTDPVTSINTDDTAGNPNISAPSNVQHVVHISQQDFNLASPALRFFPDSMKMHTWGPKSHGRSIFKSGEESDRNIITSEKPFNFEESMLQMNYTDSTESPSPCVETPSSACAINMQSESNMCSSAPNLRKISLGNLPALEFSSFRRPFPDKMDTGPADPPAIANCPSCYFKWLDYRADIPCERCTWKLANRSATIGPSSSMARTNSDRSTWSCIPKWPPDLLSDGSRKMNVPINTDSKRSKKTKHKRSKKSDSCRFNEAMWSIMRMMSAVVLPDRSIESVDALTEENIAEELNLTLEIPGNIEEFRESCSPTLSLNVDTEDEDHSSTEINDSVCQRSFSNKCPTKVPSKEPTTNTESMKPVPNILKASSLPKPGTVKSFAHFRTKSSLKNDRHCKFKNVLCAGSSAGRGNSVPASRRATPSFDLGNIVKKKKPKKSNQSTNYFASWLPFANSQVDLKSNGSQSMDNS